MLSSQEHMQALNLFYSYAHKDEVWRRRLENHLSSLQRQGLIISRHDRNVSAGREWEAEIDAYLNTAHIILMLISPDFIASEYCYSAEMKRAIERHEAGEARVIPIILRPTDWKETPLGHLQVLPKNAKPLSTWHDRDKALLEVATGIREAIEELKASPVLSSLYNTGEERMKNALSSLPIWNVPYRRNPFFTGREELLKHLHNKLKMNTTVALIQAQAISGLGGVGKTQTAVEYSYRYLNEYRYIFWVAAESRDTLTTGFITLAHLIQLPERNERDQNVIVVAIKRWLTTHGNWLLILDNADDIAIVKDFLPTKANGHIILTTRAQAGASVAAMLAVEKMDPQEAVFLLLRRAKILPLEASLDQASDQDRSPAEVIVKEMDGLPLALDQAGAYIEETGCSLAIYLDLYHRHRMELLKRTSSVHSDHPTSVATTLSLSFQQVEQANPAAANLLRLCAFLDPEAIPEEIAIVGASEPGFVSALFPVDTFALNEAIEELRKLSLVKRLPEKGLLNVHRLVQTIIKDGMDEETRERWVKQTVRMINKAFPDVFRTPWLRRSYYLSQAHACIALIQQYGLSSMEAARLLSHAADYLSFNNDDEEAIQLFQDAYSIFEQVAGPTHPDTLHVLHRQALLYDSLDKFELAEQLWRRIVTAYESLKGYEHPTTARYLGFLASCYRYQKKYEQAEPLYLRALAISEHALGDNDDRTADALLGPARLYCDQGKYEQAEPLYLRALAISENTLGSEDLYTAICLYVLADLYKDQGKYEAAEPLFQRALTIRETQGADYISIALTLERLAQIYDAQGKYEQTDSLYQRSLRVYEQAHGFDHPSVATSLEKYAIFLRKIKRDEEAAVLESRAKAIRAQTNSSMSVSEE